MSAVLDKFQQAQNEVLQRMRELEPLVREYEELRQIVERLEATGSEAPVTRSRPGAQPRRAGGRPASEGGRRDDILRIVEKTPGVTINEAGKILGVDPTGLYRPVRALVKDGQVRKQGPNLYATAAGSLRAAESLADVA